MSDIHPGDLSPPLSRPRLRTDPARLSLLDGAAYAVIIVMVCGPLAAGVLSM